jgi:hypothetical protein
MVAVRRLRIVIGALLALAFSQLAVSWIASLSLGRDDPAILASIRHSLLTMTLYTLGRETAHLWVLWRTRSGPARLPISFTLWYDATALFIALWSFIPKLYFWFSLGPNPMGIYQGASIVLLLLYKVASIIVIVMAIRSLVLLAPGAKKNVWLAGIPLAVLWTALLYGLLFVLSLIRASP